MDLNEKFSKLAHNENWVVSYAHRIGFVFFLPGNLVRIENLFLLNIDANVRDFLSPLFKGHLMRNFLKFLFEFWKWRVFII